MAALKESAVSLLSNTTLTSLAVTGARVLYTVPAGKTCVLSHAILEADGNLAADGVLTIGRSTDLDDFVGTTNVDNVDADGDCILMMPVPSATPATLKTYAAGIIISLEVVTAAAAVTGSLYLFGILY